MIRGIDVWSGQGAIDWHGLAAIGIRFAIVKCATGNEPGVDPRFAANVAGARGAGIAVGCYNFAYPLPLAAGHPGRWAAEQAEAHFKACGGLGANDGELPPALDLEWPAPQDWGRWGCTGAQIRDWGLAYLESASSLWGRKPLLYTYPDFWGHVLAGTTAVSYADYPLWMADYARFNATVPADGSSPKLPAPWATWTVWQHSGGGMNLPSGAPCDFDVFRGGEDDFARFVSRPFIEPAEPPMTKDDDDPPPQAA